MIFYNLSLSKFCTIKDPRALMKMKFNDFLDLKQFVEIMAAQERAFYIDEEREQEIKRLNTKR